MNHNTKRRAIITTLASSPVWIKPVVQQVILPAHANTTEAEALTNKSFYTPPSALSVMLEPANESGNALFDAFISPAVAGDPETQVPLGMLITLSEVGGKVVANIEYLNQQRDVKYTATNVPTDNAAASTSLSQEASCTDGGHTDIKIVGYTFNASTIDVEITTDRPAKRTQTVPLGSGSLTLLDC